MQYRLTSSPRGRLDNLCSPAILLIDIERHYFFKEVSMFDIKGIRTFATSAKDLDKAVEFYTKVIGGQIVKKVEPTEEQKQVRPSEGSRCAARQFRSASVRCVDQAARSRSASHAEYSLAGTRKGFIGAASRSVPISKKSARTATAITIRSMSSIPTATAGSCRS